MRTQSFGHREARKPKTVKREGKRVAAYKRKAMMLDAKGRLIEKDYSAYDVMLCCHGETRGGAWIVSIDPDGGNRPPQEGGIFFLPKDFVDRSEPLFGFERLNRYHQRVLITVHEFCMPKWRAVEKRIAT